MAVLDNTKKMLAYKLAGCVQGSNAINMPDEWNEAICEVSFTGGTYSKTNFIFHICKEMLDENIIAFRQGYYEGSNNYAHVSINCNINSISCATSHCGTNKASTTTFTVYYR